MYECYKYQYRETENNHKCWAYSVKQLLFSHGFGFVWLNQGVGNEVLFLNTFKQRVRDNFIQSWDSDLIKYSKLDTYRAFKVTFNCESYLATIEDNKFRSALCRLRSSSHQLRMESEKMYLFQEKIESAIVMQWKMNINLFGVPNL